MENFKVEWDQDGQRRTSVVSYDACAAEDRKRVLEGEGRANDTVVAVPIFGGKS